MREHLLELALRKASYIKNIVGETSLEPLKDLAREYWVDYEPGEVEPESYAAVDGSQNRLDFKGFTLYAVAGYSIAVSGGGDRGEVEERIVADIDILYPPGIPERIQIYRELAEAKATYLSQSIKGSRTELVMVDGSLWSLLIDPGTLSRRARIEAIIDETYRFFREKTGEEDFYKEFWRRVVEELDNTPGETLVVDPFVSKKVIAPYINELSVKDRGHILVLLEYLEKLMTIRRVLESGGIDSSPRIIYISKTSRSPIYYERYFEEHREELDKVKVPLLSDILIFSYFTKTVGYSKPIIQARHVRLKNFPDLYGLGSIISRFYDEVSYAVSYIRLEEGGPVFKIEIPLKAGRESESVVKQAERIIRRTMSFLKPLSVKGYPYPLIEADKSSKITREDMKLIASSIGLLPRLTGREVLVEWL